MPVTHEKEPELRGLAKWVDSIASSANTANQARNREWLQARKIVIGEGGLDALRNLALELRQKSGGDSAIIVEQLIQISSREQYLMSVRWDHWEIKDERMSVSKGVGIILDENHPPNFQVLISTQSGNTGWDYAFFEMEDIPLGEQLRLAAKKAYYAPDFRKETQLR